MVINTVLRQVSIAVGVGILLFSLSFWLYRIHTDDCYGQMFSHLNASLSCGTAYRIQKSSFAIFEKDLKTFVDDEIALGEVETISIYVRDLYNGPVLNINGSEEFAPASLLKLPLLVTYLSLQEEVGPSLFKTQLAYTAPDNELAQLITPERQIEEDTPYTVEELLQYMILYSDNRAYDALRSYLLQLYPDQDLLRQTFVDLGIIDPNSLFDQTLTTRAYASIFTQLFHASYLRERASSEWALNLLTQTDYTMGLEAGLPEGIEVAHKFGERFSVDDDIRQLHDCGIVYFPDNPYLICVMTRGYDINKLQGIIAEISGRVYQEFESRRL